MNNIGLFIAALFGWQRGRELLAEVDERYIRNFRAVAILTIFGYTAFCGYAAYHGLDAAPSIGWIIVVLLGGLYISLSWQGLAVIAGLSAATKSVTPLKAIGYMALVFAIPTAVSEALMLGAITKPVMLFPLYVAGTVIGIYSLLWGGNVWFKRVIMLSAIFLIGKSLVMMYYVPTETEKVADKLLKQNETRLDSNNAAYISKQGGFAAAAAKGELTPEQERKLRFAANGASILKRASAKGEELLGVIRVNYRISGNIMKLPSIVVPPGTYTWDLVGNPHITIRTPIGEGSFTDSAFSIRGGSTASGLPLPNYNAYGLILNGTTLKEQMVVGRDGVIKVSGNIPTRYEEKFGSGEWKAKELTIEIVLTPSL